MVENCEISSVLHAVVGLEVQLRRLLYVLKVAHHQQDSQHTQGARNDAFQEDLSSVGGVGREVGGDKSAIT